MIDLDLTKQTATPQHNDDDDDVERGRAVLRPAMLRLAEQTEANHQPARQWAWRQAQLVGAVVGLLGGLVAALGGSLLTAASWFMRDAGARAWLATAGSALLCLTIPLLILGACCMDWLEKKRAPRRLWVVRDNANERRIKPTQNAGEPGAL